MNVSNGSSLIQLKKSIENFLLQLKNQRSGSKTVCGFTSISNSERNHDVFKVKESMQLVKRKYKLY